VFETISKILLLDSNSLISKTKGKIEKLKFETNIEPIGIDFIENRLALLKEDLEKIVFAKKF